MSQENSCKDCQRRHCGCHSTCPIYLAYKKELEKQRRQEHLEKVCRPRAKGFYYKTPDGHWRTKK